MNTMNTMSGEGNRFAVHWFIFQDLYFPSWVIYFFYFFYYSFMYSQWLWCLLLWLLWHRIQYHLSRYIFRIRSTSKTTTTVHLLWTRHSYSSTICLLDPSRGWSNHYFHSRPLRSGNPRRWVNVHTPVASQTNGSFLPFLFTCANHVLWSSECNGAGQSTSSDEYGEWNKSGRSSQLLSLSSSSSWNDCRGNDAYVRQVDGDGRIGTSSGLSECWLQAGIQIKASKKRRRRMMCRD